MPEIPFVFEEKTESSILIGYLYISPELFSPTHRVFSKKAGTWVLPVHLKSQYAMTPLMDIAQVMRFFNVIENFNGFCRTKFQVRSMTEVKRHLKLKTCKFEIYCKAWKDRS